jgi:hypothetical protein
MVRSDGPQNEKRPFGQPRGPLQPDFEMGPCNSRARIGAARSRLTWPQFKGASEAKRKLE